MPPNIDPSEAAFFAIIAICLVLIGAILTTGVVSIEQRAVVLGGIVATLFAIAWRIRQRRD